MYYREGESIGLEDANRSAPPPHDNSVRLEDNNPRGVAAPLAQEDIQKPVRPCVRKYDSPWHGFYTQKVARPLCMR